MCFLLVVLTHPKMNTSGVNHIPCLQHKVPFQFISLESHPGVHALYTIDVASKG